MKIKSLKQTSAFIYTDKLTLVSYHGTWSMYYSALDNLNVRYFKEFIMVNKLDEIEILKHKKLELEKTPNSKTQTLLNAMDSIVDDGNS